MDREESLGRRLLNYLGASADCADELITVYFPEYSSSPFVMYFSWCQMLWLANADPRRSLMDNVKYSLSHIHGFKTANPPFEFSSLDELEMQLSIRGF